jgi:tRNA1Val (adenine37-N6)-methyltransferase
VSGVAPEADETHSLLSGDWRLFQKRRGHRWSLDDLVTAWFAARQLDGGPAPTRCLDLGCGIGSVLLMTAWRFPLARCTGIEAQALSMGLARRSIAWNGVGDRVDVRHEDFREAALEPVFELVTGTPPYFPPGTGTESTKPQAAPARFEHRGGVEAYCEAMARALTPDGIAVLCAGAGQAERMAQQTTLSVHRELPIVPKRDTPPLLFVYALGRAPKPIQKLEPLVVREADGQWTPAFLDVRTQMGMPGRP